MLIVTPQIDRRRDGLPSSSWGRGWGRREEGRGGAGAGEKGRREGKEGPLEVVMEGEGRRRRGESLDASEFPLQLSFWVGKG